MNEKLLQYIWQFGYFNNLSLQTTCGDAVQLIQRGMLNKNQGPDFINAKIRINNTVWAGSVEVHIKTSDWLKHQHSADKNYNNVILHVVYEHDMDEFEIPVLEMKTRVAASLLSRYRDLIELQHVIPCENLIHTVPEIITNAWKARLVAERLERKSDSIDQYLQKTNTHWEEIFWWMLAKNFGITVNAAAFEATAQSLPINILAKHKNNVIQLEALLLGQAGLLNGNFEDNYPRLLQKEYQFLKHKYELSAINEPVYFLRMRPGNFPTVRLAQLAAVIHSATSLFSKILEENELHKVKQLFAAEANDYWNYHYTLMDASVFKKKRLGKTMINVIIINTICPIVFYYGQHHQNQFLKDKALRWLQETMAEKNNITNIFERLEVGNKNAFDSQGLIELKNQYCDVKRCLQCAIGNYILKANS